MSRARIQEVSFLAAVVLATAAFVWLLVPYYGAVLWAVILAILFDPLQQRLEKWLGGRRAVAAGFSVLACICVVVVPGSFILASLAQEATSLYNSISTQQLNVGTILEDVRSASPPFVLEALSHLNLGDIANLQARLTSFMLQASQAIATQAVTIGQSTANLFISLGIMLYLLFFLFRDGNSLTAMIRGASPLNDRHTDRLLDKFASVVKATVVGNIIIAVIQGSIGGITFWLLGIKAAVLWGVLMAVFSLLPAVGAGLVWAPVAAYLLMSGDYMKGSILLAVGILIISTIDNLLRPPLVGKGTRLPDYLVLLSTLGGLSLIGINGFVLGPLIAALFIAVWSLFADEQPRS